MNSQQQTLTRIDWMSCFGFAQLFRGFRIAAHPTKLVLALAAVVVVYATGRVMDGIWGYQVVVDGSDVGGGTTEVRAFIDQPADAFARWREETVQRQQTAGASLLMQMQIGRAHV